MSRLTKKSYIAVAGVLFSAPVLAQVTGPQFDQDYTKVFLMLVIVVGLIFACAWLIRRMSGGMGVNQKHLRVLSVMPLGTREKIMIIKAANEYLLIGVTPTGIQTLHRFEEPIDINDTLIASPFADRLKGILKGLDSDPLAKHRKSTDHPEN
ncbi:flagellar biosynthetic protein FliO [Reinekea marinisedimentorum]|uniref:Flagellar protein n=1 Tax=Reinekea marinisedimentorum TaxID=230495 RepID=A0A4R3ICS9_9GAMM|nr:flagellar biosynthetic protein FliO [Reinekea marinisedimentorum]TCS42425.1 flagellar biosynthetic protein FliO [Reinekea marinisedimentorum]